MIRRKILNIASLLIILTLLPATSGVTIFHHICNEKGTHTVSIYSDMECDKYEKETSACEHCVNHIKNCSMVEKNNCMEYVEFLTIDTDFLTTSKLIIQPAVYDLPVRELHSSIEQNNQYPDYSTFYFKQDFKNPVTTDISFIIFQSQSKSSEIPSDIFIS